MNNCTEYLDLISAFADGIISDEEKIKLEAHLSQCQKCEGLLSAFYEISAAFEETEVCAPDGFSGGVMARLENGGDFETDDEPQGAGSGGVRKSRATVKKAVVRYAAAAACLAVIILAAGKLSGFGQKFSFSPSANEMASGQAASGGSAEHSTADMDGGADIYQGSGYEDAAAVPPAQAPRDEAPMMSAPAGESGAGGNMAASDLQGTEDLQETESIINHGYIHKSGDYYAIIDISGVLPEVLETYEREDMGGGVYNIYIPRETAIELIESGFTAEIINEDALDAMVAYTP